ncbi:MAG: helix-turn-helix domain-containing protein [Clostridia bacterium]|nr:helix-turn-helix domain-containing protein [Clostridia bacterium]
MKSTEHGVLETSDLYFFSPSQIAKKLHFYPVSAGHFFCVKGYHLIRENYDSLLVTHIIRGSFTYIKNGQHHTAYAGETVILDCYKNHEYYTNDSFESIWVHFSGSNCLAVYHEIERTLGSTVCCRNPHRTEEMLFRLFDAISGEKNMTETELSLELYKLLMELMAPDSSPESQTGRYDALIQDVKDYISAHLSERLLVRALAERVYMSSTHFSRIFKHQTGLSPYEYVLIMRINRAKELLHQTDWSISRIAYSVGFNSESNFIRFFSLNTGITPNRFRKLKF